MFVLDSPPTLSNPFRELGGESCPGIVRKLYLQVGALREKVHLLEKPSIRQEGLLIWLGLCL